MRTLFRSGYPTSQERHKPFQIAWKIGTLTTRRTAVQDGWLTNDNASQRGILIMILTILERQMLSRQSSDDNTLLLLVELRFPVIEKEEIYFFQYIFLSTRWAASFSLSPFGWWGHGSGVGSADLLFAGVHLLLNISIVLCFNVCCYSFSVSPSSISIRGSIWIFFWTLCLGIYAITTGVHSDGIHFEFGRSMTFSIQKKNMCWPI